MSEGIDAKRISACFIICCYLNTPIIAFSDKLGLRCVRLAGAALLHPLRARPILNVSNEYKANAIQMQTKLIR